MFGPLRYCLRRSSTLLYLWKLEIYQGLWFLFNLVLDKYVDILIVLDELLGFVIVIIINEPLRFIVNREDQPFRIRFIILLFLTEFGLMDVFNVAVIPKSCLSGGWIFWIWLIIKPSLQLSLEPCSNRWVGVFHGSSATFIMIQSRTLNLLPHNSLKFPASLSRFSIKPLFPLHNFQTLPLLLWQSIHQLLVLFVNDWVFLFVFVFVLFLMFWLLEDLLFSEFIVGFMFGKFIVSDIRLLIITFLLFITWTALARTFRFTTFCRLFSIIKLWH